MTATVTQIEQAHVDCITCDGAGEYPSGKVDPDTGTTLTTECSHCSGNGVVDAEWVVEACEICKEPYWAGDGCPHNNLCEDDREHCTECMADASNDSYEASREAELMGGFR